MNYDKDSFLAGLALGKQMKGWSAYGVVAGWNPDGDLILRPITQGFPSIRFNTGRYFEINSMIDFINEEETFPLQELLGLSEDLSSIAFSKDQNFSIMNLNERLVVDEVITAYTVDENINPLEYDDTIVFINSNGAFTMNEITRTFTSTAQTVDIGTMQEVAVKVNEFAEVTTQEVTT